MASVQRWTNLACAGGRKVGRRITILDGSTVTQTATHDDEFVLVTPVEYADEIGEHTILELIDDDGESTEWIVRAKASQDDMPSATITCEPAVDYLLGELPPVRIIDTSGNITTRLVASLSAEYGLTTLMLPNLSDDGAPWLEIDVVEPPDILEYDLDAVNPKGFIQATCELVPSGAVYTLVRNANTSYKLSILNALSGNVVRGVLGDDVTRLTQSTDVNDAATCVYPFGADDGTGRATLADAAWRVSALTSTTFEVVDPSTGVSPFIAADQAQGWFARKGTSTFGPITTSSVDGVCTLASTSGLALDDVITFDEDTSGKPVLALTYPERITNGLGRVTRRLLGDWKRQRTLLKNPQLSSDALPWAYENSDTGVVIPRSELNLTRSGLVNGARAAATGTGTPFALDGFPANTKLFRGDELHVGGAILTPTADVVPNSSGGMTIVVNSPGLPGAYANSDPVTLIRKESRTLYSDGAQSKLTPGLKIKVAGDGGLYPFVGNGFQEPTGATLSQSAVVQTAFSRLDQPFVNAGTGGAVKLPQFARLSFTYQAPAGGITDHVFTPLSMPTALSADSFSCVVDTTTFPIGITTSSVMHVALAPDGFVTYDAFSFVSLVGNVATFTRLNWRDADEVGYSCLASTFPYWMSGGLYVERRLSDQTWADNTAFAYERVLETRTLLLSGSHISGATSLVFQNVAALAKHDWTSSDTVYLQRITTGLVLDLNTGGVGSETYDGVSAYDQNLIVPYIAGSSTMDDVPSGDWSGANVYFNLAVYFNGLYVTQTWKLDALSGGSAYFSRRNATPNAFPSGGDDVVAGAYTASDFITIDAYPVASSASWGTNGRATVPITIPSGRSYERGALAWANWHGGLAAAQTGANTNLRVNATVTGSASSIELFGDDGYSSSWNGSTSMNVGLYRVYSSGSTLPILGEILYVATSITANGSGVVAPTLTAANVRAVADNTPVTITRPDLVPSTMPSGGSIVRLNYAVGGIGAPVSSTPCWRDEDFTVRVASGTTKIVTVWARFAVQGPITHTPGSGPVVAVFNGTTLLGYTPLAETTTFAAGFWVVTLKYSLTIAATTTLTVKCYGGSATYSAPWTALLEANAYTDTSDVLEVMPSPLPNAGWHAANRVLVAQSIPLESIAITRSQAGERLRKAWDASVRVGTTFVMRRNGVSAQVVSVTRHLLDPSKDTMLVSTDSQLLTAQLATIERQANKTRSATSATTGSATAILQGA